MFSRREFLKLGGAAAAAATAVSCSNVGRQITQSDLPEVLTVPSAVPTAVPDSAIVVEKTAVNPIWRILNRAGYGPRPGDFERVTGLGLAAYLDEQLNPEAIDDTAADLIDRNLTFYQMDIGQLAAQEEIDIGRELVGAAIARKLHSKKQLYEAMVEFWSDHFNIYLRKNKFMPALKLVDDRDVIRPHTLGKFRDLLKASAHSAAMLVYLDNGRNHKDAPNENYARELMELHTLGVNGGYSQQDVAELARILTGWMVRRRGLREGQVFLNEEAHDFGEKQLLGQTFPAGRGAEEIEAALDLLAAHPATADFISFKLARRFVADEPPAALVKQVAQTFRDTDGDIKAMLRVIFLSDELATAPLKLKRPFTFMVSSLRALNADLRPSRQIGRWLELLGQPLFLWPPPDGYPDTADAWTANLLPRWNFALNLLHSQIPGAEPPLEKLAAAGSINDVPNALNLLAGLTLGHALDGEADALFNNYVGSGELGNGETRQRLQDAAALMIASPAFQWT